MSYYQKKPVVIEAFLWTGGPDQTEDPEWAVEAIKDGRLVVENSGTEDVKLKIQTLEGPMYCLPGDYVLKDVKGEVYFCAKGVFEQNYTRLGRVEADSGPQKLYRTENCARCGGEHLNDFKPLSRPSDEWKHFAICPVTNEPVMLAIEETKVKAPPEFQNEIQGTPYEYSSLVHPKWEAMLFRLRSGAFICGTWNLKARTYRFVLSADPHTSRTNTHIFITDWELSALKELPEFKRLAELLNGALGTPITFTTNDCDLFQECLIKAKLLKQEQESV